MYVHMLIWEVTVDSWDWLAVDRACVGTPRSLLCCLWPQMTSKAQNCSPHIQNILAAFLYSWRKEEKGRPSLFTVYVWAPRMWYTEQHLNQFNSFWDIYVCVKVVDRPTDRRCHPLIPWDQHGTTKLVNKECIAFGCGDYRLSLFKHVNIFPVFCSRPVRKLMFDTRFFLVQAFTCESLTCTLTLHPPGCSPQTPDYKLSLHCALLYPTPPLYRNTDSLHRFSSCHFKNDTQDKLIKRRQINWQDVVLRPWETNKVARMK